MNGETTTWWIRKYDGKLNIAAKYIVTTVSFIEKIYGYFKTFKKTKRHS